jgi:peptidoglycan/xylan/chitin deacetylase (PgdA/CDA1 family)
MKKLLQQWLSYEHAERLRSAACAGLLYTGVGPLLATLQPKGASILIYHSVGGSELFSDNAIPVSAFERQMRFIRQNARPVPLSRIVARLAEGGVPEADWVAVTFDDGYRDFLTTALPVLARYEIPVSIFIPTAILAGRELFFDDIESCVRAARGSEIRLRLRLGAGELRLPIDSPVRRRDASLRIALAVRQFGPAERTEAMLALRRACGVEPQAADGVYLSRQEIESLPDWVEVGSHSVEHYCLPALNDAELSQELAAAAADLAAVRGRPVVSLAYPFGKTWAFDDRVVAFARATGHVAALTTLPGKVRQGSDPFRLPRIAGTPSWTRFRLNLAGLPI